MTSPSLNTLLATRLDAVLGTTLAQHPLLIDGGATTGAPPPGAVPSLAPPGQRPPRPDARATAARDTAASTREAATDTPTAGRTTEAGSGSARTHLSEPARTILALLVARPDVASAVRGATPILTLAAQGMQGMQSAQGASAAKGAQRAQGMQGSQAAQGMQAAQGTQVTQGSHAAPRAQGMQSAQGANTAQGAQAAQAPASGAAPAPRQASGALAAGFAAALHGLVSDSGLFYESHLAQVAFGERDPQDLRREPQAGWRPAADAAGDASGRATDDAAGRSTHDASGSAPHDAGGRATGAAAARATAEPMPGPAGPDRGTPAPSVPGLSPQACVIVRQQLDVLAHAAFHWQGQAWSDAPLDWEIHEQSSPASDSPAWSTRLRLHSPHLGQIDAHLALGAGLLQVRLHAAQAAAYLQPNVDLLRERLADTGLAVAPILIDATPGTP